MLGGASVREDLEVDLLHDLALLCEGHLLIRADVKGATLSPYLKRSDALTDKASALTYLKTVVAAYVESGGRSDDLCFIAHRFIRARAAAWAAAWPNKADVRIDSVWGLADGLGYLPHDTAWVNTDIGKVQRSTHAKNQFLNTSANGTDWHYETTPTEWIWKASATRDQLQTIAQASRRIASRRGEPVLVMWFVGVLDGFDSDCLAWVANSHAGEGAVDRARFDEYERYAITCVGDLESFTPKQEPTVLLLEPVEDLLRNIEFLDRVAETCREHMLSVELRGSSLAHAYYQLTKAGVVVLCAERPPAPRREFNKLVRDNIVPRVQAQGEAAVAYTATAREHRELLKRKLVEEAVEVLEADGEGALLEELADVEEVLSALRQALDIERDTVAEVQAEKRQKRGGFDARSVLVSTGTGTTRDEDALFDVEELYRPAPARQIEVRNGVAAFSLVPPPLGHRSQFVLEIGEYEIRGQYKSHELTIEVVKGTPGPAAAAEQLFPMD